MELIISTVHLYSYYWQILSNGIYLVGLDRNTVNWTFQLKSGQFQPWPYLLGRFFRAAKKFFFLSGQATKKYDIFLRLAQAESDRQNRVQLCELLRTACDYSKSLTKMHFCLNQKPPKTLPKNSESVSDPRDHPDLNQKIYGPELKKKKYT